MPVYAFLEYRDLPCPRCLAPLRCGHEPEPCHITFQWGYCETRYGYASAYQLGEEIQWRRSRDGAVRGWASFNGGSRFNVGDPSIRSVIVTDVGADAAHFPQTCSACGAALGGAALHVRENVIVSAWAFLPGELLPGVPAVYLRPGPDGVPAGIPAAEAHAWEIVNYYVEQDDHSWRPMPEWEVHPFTPA